MTAHARREPRPRACPALALACALALVTLAGCARPAAPTSEQRLAPSGASGIATTAPPAHAAPDAKAVIGRWRAADTAGKSASLSDLTLYPDGTFRYAGKNALGGPVAFGGTYATGVFNRAPWIRLIYDDYPDRPTVWFYRRAGDKLSVSSVLGNLDNGAALVFTKR